MNYVNATGQAVDIATLKHKHKPIPRGAADARKRTTDRSQAKMSCAPTWRARLDGSA